MRLEIAREHGRANTEFPYKILKASPLPSRDIQNTVRTASHKTLKQHGNCLWTVCRGGAYQTYVSRVVSPALLLGETLELVEERRRADPHRLVLRPAGLLGQHGRPGSANMATGLLGSHPAHGAAVETRRGDNVVLGRARRLTFQLETREPLAAVTTAAQQIHTKNTLETRRRGMIFG